MFRQSVWMLVASLFFALVAVSIKHAVDVYSTFEFLFYRSIAGVATCLYVLKKSGGTIKTSHPMRHLVRCAIGTFCLCLSIYILKGLPIATAQALQYTSPLWFCVFLMIASVFDKEKISKSLLGAVLVGFIGIITILRPEFGGQDAFWALMGVLTGFAGGGADFMIRDLGRHKEPKERIIFYFTLSGALVGLVATLATTGFHSHTTEGLLALAALMFCGTAGQFALTQAWTFGHPILNSIFQFSSIPFAIIFGVLFFDEHLDWMTIVGIMIVMFAGIVASVIRIRSERLGAAGKPVELKAQG